MPARVRAILFLPAICKNVPKCLFHYTHLTYSREHFTLAVHTWYDK